MKLSITLDDSGKLRMSGCLDIYAADSARDALIACVRDKAEPAIDLHEIESCDTAGIQVLCSAKSSAAISNKRLTFEHASGALISRSEKLGCRTLFSP